MKHRYLDRDGNETDARHATDERGILKDGYRVIVHSRFRDNDGSAKDGTVMFTDGTADGGNRPGWRLNLKLSDKRQAVVDAYAEVEMRQQNAYKVRDGVHLCGDCLGSGLGDDNEACSGCGGSGVQDDGYETSPNEAVENTAVDSRPLAQRMQDHRRTMDQLYAQRDAELSEAWRNK